MEQSNIRMCESCGCVIEDNDGCYEIDGKPYCKDCVIFCAICGDPIIDGDGYEVKDSKVVCKECLKWEYRKCTVCGQYFNWNEECYESNQMGNYICEDCAKDYQFCVDCGTLIHLSDDPYTYDERRCEYHCGDCSGVHEYGYEPEWEYFRTDTDVDEAEALYFGVELENNFEGGSGACQDARINNQVSSTLENDFDVYCCDDCSISGIEVISHPATLAYHCDNMGWGRICEELQKHYEEESDCGLHIHIGLHRNYYIDVDYWLTKCIVLCDVIADKLPQFCRRDFNRWCYKPNAGVEADDDGDTVEEKVETAKLDRYHAVTGGTNNTIEFRLPNATLDPMVIKATLIFTSRFANYALNHSISECLDATFDDVINTDTDISDTYNEILNHYLEMVGLR